MYSIISTYDSNITMIMPPNDELSGAAKNFELDATLFRVRSNDRFAASNQ